MKNPLDFRRHAQLQQTIRDFAERLAASAPLKDEMVACHEAKLVVETDTEARLRSIQSLAELGAPSGIGPAVNALVQHAGKWPWKSARERAYARILLHSLALLARRREIM